jgi:chitin disaccharide deacetylase
MTARNLIVNADDFNSDEERNRGILEAAEKGIVTSVSVIANLPFNAESVSKLKTVFGPRIGIHLNLTKGAPIARRITSLVDESGQFFKKKNAWRRALLHQYDLKEVEGEFAAQISRLRELGITPDHLDGNNHLHIFPHIAEVVARLARDFNIKKIRLPLENFQNPGHYFQPKAFKKYFFGLLAKRASFMFKSFNLLFPEHFAGIQFPQVAEIESLRKFFRALPPGTTELMCHPGYRNVSMPLSPQSKHEEELASLTTPEVLAALEQEQITLISFHDMQGL